MQYSDGQHYMCVTYEYIENTYVSRFYANGWFVGVFMFLIAEYTFANPRVQPEYTSCVVHSSSVSRLQEAIRYLMKRSLRDLQT